MKSFKSSVLIIAGVAGLICFLFYLRALWCGFVTLDDPDYVTENLLIRRLDWNLLVRSFTEPHAGWWMPLTWISFAIDYYFCGLNPLGYHLTNILLHALNTGLVALIAERYCRYQCATLGDCSLRTYRFVPLLAALMWGLHPLRVESVAWITERKDVLNGFFTLSSVLAYFCYVAKKEQKGRASIFYVLSLVLFLLSLMAKSISVVLPVILLVLDWYPLKRLKSGDVLLILREKLPYFIISIFISLMTIHLAQNADYLVNTQIFSFNERLVVSGHAIIEYLRYLVLPAGITPFHAVPDPVPVGRYLVDTLLIAGITLMAILKSRRSPWGISLWLLFVIPFLPVLAFFQNGEQEFAARFSYLPSVAASVAVAVCSAQLHSKMPQNGLRTVLTFCAFAVGFCYLVMSVRLITVWDDSITLWTRVIDMAPSSNAYWNRATYSYTQGDYRASINDFTASMAFLTPVRRPYVFNLYAHRGEAFRSAGLFEKAVSDFNQAIALHPHPLYYYYRAITLEALGRMSEAEDDYEKADGVSGPLVVLH